MLRQSTTKKTTVKRGRPKKSEAEAVALRKRLREEEKELASRPVSTAKEIPYTAKDSLNKEKEFIIVLTAEGDLFIDPVPQYCDFNIYKAFAACTSEIDKGVFSFKSNLSITAYGNMEIVTGTYDTPKKLNPFVELFDIKNATKAIGGNIVFTMPNRPFTKKEADKYYKIIVKDLQKEIAIDACEE